MHDAPTTSLQPISRQNVGPRCGRSRSSSTRPTAPPPRRHRTWVHRVRVAVDALHVALQAQVPRPDDPLRLLDEIALAHPAFIERVKRLQQDLRDLTIAVASLREHLEDDSAVVIDPADVSERLGALTTQFHRHQEGEATLVYETMGRNIDEIC